MKIEEGCLAIVINSVVPKNICKCVKVLKFIGTLDMVGSKEGVLYKDLWEVSESMFFKDGHSDYSQREVNLMRIDGIKDSETIKQTEVV